MSLNSSGNLRELRKCIVIIHCSLYCHVSSCKCFRFPLYISSMFILSLICFVIQEICRSLFSLYIICQLFIKNLQLFEPHNIYWYFGYLSLMFLQVFQIFPIHYMATSYI
jgi:hypothetical protein